MILLSVTLTGLAFTVFMTAVSRLVVKPLEFNGPAYHADISVAFDIIGIDPIARILQIDWYAELAGDCSINQPPVVADIYVNPGYLDTSSPSFSIDAPYPPAFQFNSTRICDGLTPIISATFRTVSKLLTGDSDPIRSLDIDKSSTLQNYPVDVYYARIFLYALDHETKNSIQLNITRAFGVAVNFEVEKVFSLTQTPEPQMLLRIQRSLATKIFVYAIAVTNWLVAIAFLVICASTVIYPRPEIYSELFIVPVGAVFALTTMRSNMPGAPVGFGATIDLYTILPVLVLTALCSSYLLLIVLYQRLARAYKREPDPEDWHISCYSSMR